MRPMQTKRERMNHARLCVRATASVGRFWWGDVGSCGDAEKHMLSASSKVFRKANGLKIINSKAEIFFVCSHLGATHWPHIDVLSWENGRRGAD